MPREVWFLFALALGLYTMQSIGGIFQIKNYKQSIRRVRQYGTVGVGQRRGRFFNGYLVLIACDKAHQITRFEVMDGKTFLAKFHPIKTFLGKEILGVSIEDLLLELRAMDKKHQKRNRGYIQALEALEMRFQREASQSEELVVANALSMTDGTKA